MRFIFNKMVLLIITISLFFGGWMLLKEESVNESNLPKPDVVTVWSMSSIVRDPNLALNESQNFQVSLLYLIIFQKMVLKFQSHLMKQELSPMVQK